MERADGNAAVAFCHQLHDLIADRKYKTACAELSSSPYVKEAVEWTDEHQNTLLHVLLESDSVWSSDANPKLRLEASELVALLLRKRAPVDAVNRRRRTPLHLAAIAGNLDLCKILVLYRASLLVRDSRDRLPEDYAIFHRHNNVADFLAEKRTQTTTPSHDAVIRGAASAARSKSAAAAPQAAPGGNDVTSEHPRTTSNPPQHWGPPDSNVRQRSEKPDSFVEMYRRDEERRTDEAHRLKNSALRLQEEVKQLRASESRLDREVLLRNEMIACLEAKLGDSFVAGGAAFGAIVRAFVELRTNAKHEALQSELQRVVGEHAAMTETCATQAATIEQLQRDLAASVALHQHCDESHSALITNLSMSREQCDALQLHCNKLQEDLALRFVDHEAIERRMLEAERTSIDAVSKYEDLREAHSRLQAFVGQLSTAATAAVEHKELAERCSENISHLEGLIQLKSEAFGDAQRECARLNGIVLKLQLEAASTAAICEQSSLTSSHMSRYLEIVSEASTDWSALMAMHVSQLTQSTVKADMRLQQALGASAAMDVRTAESLQTVIDSQQTAMASLERTLSEKATHTATLKHALAASEEMLQQTRDELKQMEESKTALLQRVTELQQELTRAQLSLISQPPATPRGASKEVTETSAPDSDVVDWKFKCEMAQKQVLAGLRDVSRLQLDIAHRSEVDALCSNEATSRYAVVMWADGEFADSVWTSWLDMLRHWSAAEDSARRHVAALNRKAQQLGEQLDVSMLLQGKLTTRVEELETAAAKDAAAKAQAAAAAAVEYRLQQKIPPREAATSPPPPYEVPCSRCDVLLEQCFALRVSCDELRADLETSSAAQAASEAVVRRLEESIVVSQAALSELRTELSMVSNNRKQSILEAEQWKRKAEILEAHLETFDHHEDRIRVLQEASAQQVEGMNQMKGDLLAARSELDLITRERDDTRETLKLVEKELGYREQQVAELEKKLQLLTERARQQWNGNEKLVALLSSEADARCLMFWEQCDAALMLLHHVASAIGSMVLMKVNKHGSSGERAAPPPPRRTAWDPCGGATPAPTATAVVEKSFGHSVRTVSALRQQTVQQQRHEPPQTPVSSRIDGEVDDSLIQDAEATAGVDAALEEMGSQSSAWHTRPLSARPPSSSTVRKVFSVACADMPQPPAASTSGLAWVQLPRSGLCILRDWHDASPSAVYEAHCQLHQVKPIPSILRLLPSAAGTFGFVTKLTSDRQKLCRSSARALIDMLMYCGEVIALDLSHSSISDAALVYLAVVVGSLGERQEYFCDSDHRAPDVWALRDIHLDGTLVSNLEAMAVAAKGLPQLASVTTIQCRVLRESTKRQVDEQILLNAGTRRPASLASAGSSTGSGQPLSAASVCSHYFRRPASAQATRGN